MNKKGPLILLVDDEPDILEFVGFVLQQEGYEVVTAQNGKEAIRKAVEAVPSLIILDVMMPEMDGIETCREMRELRILDNTLIAFFSARTESYSIIAGLEAGAIDYMIKPIKPRVLVSKVNALLRSKAEAPAIPNVIQIENLAIYNDKYSAYLNNKPLDLPRKEFELLAFLASKHNLVCTRAEISKSIWADALGDGDRTIDVHIRKLRRKIGDDKIQTIKGVGYKFQSIGP